jgi:hypothetical protein
MFAFNPDRDYSKPTRCLMPGCWRHASALVILAIACSPMVALQRAFAQTPAKPASCNEPGPEPITFPSRVGMGVN